VLSLGGSRKMSGLSGSSGSSDSGFKARVDDHWQPYVKEVNELLRGAYVKGYPSVRFCVKGQMYKFDFKRMVQKNLLTGETFPMCAPLGLMAPERGWFSPPVFVVAVQPGAPGTTIQVQHPKKLGKTLSVAVPKDAQPGIVMYVQVPQSELRTKATFAGVGAGAATAVVAGANVVGGGGLAGGAAAVAAGIGGPALIGGVLAAGAIAAGAVGVRAAMDNPRKALAACAAAIGGMAVVDHIGEHGLAETVEGAADGAGDLVDGAAAAAEEVLEASLALGDLSEATVDWFTADAGSFDVIADLF